MGNIEQDKTLWVGVIIHGAEFGLKLSLLLVSLLHSSLRSSHNPVLTHRRRICNVLGGEANRKDNDSSNHELDYITVDKKVSPSVIVRSTHTHNARKLNKTLHRRRTLRKMCWGESRTRPPQLSRWIRGRSSSRGAKPRGGEKTSRSNKKNLSLEANQNFVAL